MRVSSPVFVGRDDELTALDAALQRAADGRAQSVVIAGDSGVGKTRLLGEFRRRAGDATGRWLAGECIALAEGELPYAPIRGALRSMVREPEGLPVTPESAPELARLLPQLGSAPTDASPPAEELPAMILGGEVAQGRLFEQFLSLLGELSSERPIVLAIEDLHWADRSTRNLLSFLIRNAAPERVLLICTYRSDELHRRHPLRPFLAEHKRLAWVEVVELAPFTPSELGAQLQGILGGPPDPEFAGRLFERSEGNAFFAEELLAASAAKEVLLPATVSDALMLRVEALSEPTQEVLRVAAAAGRRVGHPLLAAVAGLPEPQLTAALREAVAHQILVQDSGQASYAFRHALLAEAISADLIPGERTRLHLALAEALAADPDLATESAGDGAGELAFHWRGCHRFEEALTASVEAGLAAESSCAPAEANRCLEDALELWDRVEDAERRAGMDHPATLLRAAENAGLAGQAERAVALARVAVAETDAADDPARAGLARERLGQFLWLAGESDGAIDVLREAVDLLPAEPPGADRARVLAGEARMLMLHGRPHESRARCEQAISIARSAGARAEEGHALNTLGCDLLLFGDREGAIANLRASKQIAEECVLEDLWRAYGNLAEALDQDGRLEEAVELGIKGAEVVRELGQPSWTAFILGWVASRLVRLGRLDEAERVVAMGLETPIESIDMSTLRGIDAEIHMHRGDLKRARARLDRAMDVAGRTSDAMIRGMLDERLALVEVLSGNPERAAALVDEALAGIDHGEYLFYTGRMYALAVRARADQAERARGLGNPDLAAQAERANEGLAGRLRALLDPGRWLDSPPPESVARAAVVAAEAARCRGASAPELWDDAAARWAELGFAIELAYARWRHAEAVLGAGGARADAAEPLQEAARLTAEAGATQLGAEVEALARRARIELGDVASPAAAHGPVREPGRFGLTDRELEVLALVAEGRTNPEIGEALFIAPKTASAHVSHILAKLEVRSRVEAATVAHRLGLVPLTPQARD